METDNSIRLISFNVKATQPAIVCCSKLIIKHFIMPKLVSNPDLLLAGAELLASQLKFIDDNLILIKYCVGNASEKVKNEVGLWLF